jgi:hypothetical protein
MLVDGEKLIKGVTPRPESVTTFKLPPTLIVIAPKRIPRAVGANRILIVHVDPAAMGTVQSLVLVKSPTVVMLEIFRPVAPVFDRPSAVAGLVVPIL